MEEAIQRINGIIMMAGNMKKLDPNAFGHGPVADFLEALEIDLKEAIDALLEDDDA